ncbi:MAG: DUF1223 domain-containing protein [Pseudomonadales bacterium]|nr:DUF1223 domain-containing protein [Pseudomonadales bacterium]
MSNQTLTYILLAATLSFVSKASAAPLLLESGERPAIVLELYTSQGCSSCPPAERWLSSFVDEPSLWKDIIPINFHVDYWDYLGWKDPFARPGFSKRQRNYKQLGHTRNVATPGFVVNGKGWNGWFRQKAVPHESDIVNVNLKAVVDSDKVSITFDAVDKRRVRVHVAVLGFGIKTPIKHGENRGLALVHDFVVVGYDNALLKGDKGGFSADLRMPTILTEWSNTGVKTKLNAKRHSVVVWVSEQSDVAPIQAVAGWL